MAGDAFTVMAILDAQDRASAIIDKAQAVIERFAEVMKGASDEASAAGEKIDESLLKTASGTDALTLANDRVAASTARVTLATQDQAVAEQLLRDVRESGASEKDLSDALDILTQAEKNTAKASAELEAAQKLQGDTALAAAGKNTEAAAKTEAAATASKGLGGILLGAGTLMAAAGYETLKAAGDYQSAVEHLLTDAGESASNMKMVSDGLLQIAADTGTSAIEIANGMYHIESAGFHGKAGLDMMRVAAEGAKVGGADVDTVAHALAGTMDSFKDKGYTAVQVMNALIETTSQGDLRMQDLASSLGAVGAIADASGLSIAQVGGAIATMTSQNMTAQQATQNLTNLLTHLEKPNNIQKQQMKDMGIDADDLSSHLGERGLTGTLGILIEAISKHLKNGQVFIDSFKNSTKAVESAKIMLDQMPPSIKGMAQAYLEGKMATEDYDKAAKALPAGQNAIAKQFESLVNKSGDFNKMLAAGDGDAQTLNATLENLTGGQIGLRTALMLTTDKGATFQQATDKIQGSVDKAGTSVQNWGDIQHTFNQKVDDAKAKLEVLAIHIGEKLIPVIEKLLGWMGKLVDIFEKHKELTKFLAVGLGVTLATAIAVVTAVAVVATGVIATFGAVLYYLAKAVEWVWDRLKGFWNDTKRDIEDFKQHFTDMINHVISKIYGLPDQFRGIGNQFQDVGWNMIEGIIKGVGDASGRLMAKLSDLGSQALKAAKDAIESKSPSRKFANEVGKWIPLGIAAGIDEHTPAALSTVSSMTKSLVGASTSVLNPALHGISPSFGLTGASAVGSFAGGSAAGGGVVIDMRGSQVMSDRDMDVFADRVGRRITKYVLPAGGVRIRM